MKFSNVGLKIDRKWNSGRFCACAAEIAKIPEIVVAIFKISRYIENRAGRSQIRGQILHRKQSYGRFNDLE